MGRPGPDPRPPARYADDVTGLSCRSPRASTRPTSQRQAPPVRRGGADDPGQIDQLQLDYQGRAGSLLGRRRARRRPGQDPEAHRPAQEHRDHVRLRQRLAPGRAPGHRRQVPPLRGVAAGAADPPRPGRQEEHRPSRARSPTSTSLHPARLRQRAGGPTMDGLSLLPTLRKPGKRPDRVLEIEALAPLFPGGNIPVNAWDRPYRGVRTDQYTYVVWTQTGETSSTTGQPTPTSSTTSPATPPTRRSRPTSRRSWRSSRTASARRAKSRPEARRRRPLRRAGVRLAGGEPPPPRRQPVPRSPTSSS